MGNDLQFSNNENYSSLQTKFSDLDADNKNNTQKMFTLQETINFQSEEVKKVDAERQMAANKVREDIESTAASNSKAITELRNEVSQSIAEKIRPTEEKLANVDEKLQDIENQAGLSGQKIK